jgi:hypothetical protein
MADDRNIYDEIALIVGDVCLRWASIESVIHDICLHLADEIDGSDFSHRKAWDLLHVALSQMDIRQKIAVAKVYAHQIKNPYPGDFYDRTESLLNYIDNAVRLERNRYIHDEWETEGSEIVRAKLGATVQRPQSHQRIIAIWSERRYQNLEAMREFVKNLEFVYADLVDLDAQTANFDWPPERRAKQPPLIPQEWRSLAHHGWRGPHTPRPQHGPSQG